MKKIQLGMIWDCDGHMLEVTKMFKNGKCRITETWIAEDTGKECRKTETYRIGTDENGYEFAFIDEYWSLHSSAAINAQEDEITTNDEVTTNDEEEMTMTNTANTNTAYTSFTIDGILYESTPNGRFYGTINGKKTRIGKAAFECEFKRYVKSQAEEEQFEEKIVKIEEDIMTEELQEFEKEIKKETKKAAAKKEKKPSKPKAKKVQVGGMEFSEDGISVILTPKQVDFIRHLPDTSFWEDGVQSAIWIDCLCDEIGGQFAARPMTVGAMISTLCEKGLGVRAADRRNNRKCTSFQLTELGQKIAAQLGL